MKTIEQISIRRSLPNRKILLLDQDGILADTNIHLIAALNKRHGFTYTADDHDILFGDHECLTPEVSRAMLTKEFNEPGFFRALPPIKDAIKAVEQLHTYYDIYVLTTPWKGNPYCGDEKIDWVNEHLPFLERKVIQACHKEAVYGDILVDDKMKNLSIWKRRWPNSKTASLKYHWTDSSADIIAPNWNELCDRLIEEAK